MNILADNQIPLVESAFSDFAQVRTMPGRDILPHHLHDIDALLIRSVTRIDASLLSGSSVQFVGTATSGFDHIDEAYCQQQGISLAYAPGSNARSVAEYILSVLLFLHQDDFTALAKKTVGIIGYGYVGSMVGRLLDAVGIDYEICDPPLALLHTENSFLPMEDILQCDIITLHVPLTDQGPHATRDLIGAEQIAAMKPDAILINTARGGVVTESELLSALQQQSIRAVIDTWQHEPRINSALLEAVQLGTPHIAGYSLDGKIRATEMLYQCFCQVFDQPKPWNVELLAETEPTQINAPHEDDSWQALNAIVQGVYDCNMDYQNLLHSLHLTENERGAYFDQLRREYPARREFPHYLCVPTTNTQPIDERLQALGFQAGAGV